MKTTRLNKLSPQARELLLKYEVGGGRSYYEKYLSKFTWPGGASGPTIGIGIDCAYYKPEELRVIFSFLPKNHIDLICDSYGKTGEDGKNYTKTLRAAGIEVGWSEAVKIFEEIIWVKFSSLAERVFPGLDKLCPNAYGAIVSLVFNRGGNLKGDSRLEMRNIKKLIPNKNYKQIAAEVRKMKRIWVGKNLDGLLERRDAEASLIEQCSKK